MDKIVEAVLQKYGNVEPYVNARTLSMHLGISIHAVYKMSQRGQLPCYHIGKSLRFKISEVEASIKEIVDI